MINDKYLISIRNYIKGKTGILYFKDIRLSGDNLIVSCPFHKMGQETKPSASIRVNSSEIVNEGQFHCFTCGKSMMLSQVVKELLGDLYNEDEVESLFNFSTLLVQTAITEQHKSVYLDIPEELTYNDETLKKYDYYHEYLFKRGITEETAKKYSLGYDGLSKQITFPIRDINRYCIGIGRRSIDKKYYNYPLNMIKPLYRSL